LTLKFVDPKIITKDDHTDKWNFNSTHWHLFWEN